MTADSAPERAGPDVLLDLCTEALPEVYGFLLARCGDRWTAEDLTSETFMAAASAVRRGLATEITVGWLIVVARRRLIDHWRRQEREAQRLRNVTWDGIDDASDAWEEPIDIVTCRCALQRLGPHHRSVLTLRYLDGLSVTQVALELGRGYQATEALLHRARCALRAAYQEVQAHA